jgi:hypothetical protein
MTPVNRINSGPQALSTRHDIMSARVRLRILAMRAIRLRER